MRNGLVRSLLQGIMLLAAAVALSSDVDARSGAEFDCQNRPFSGYAWECTQTSGDPLECTDVGDDTCVEICEALSQGGGLMPQYSCSDGPPLTFDCVCSSIE
jgi:hypothetical protein